MRLAVVIVALLLTGLAALPAEAQRTGRCIVSDPTGSPLNVRSSPQGQVVATISNGTAVRVVQSATDNRGQPWAFVVLWESGQPVGWVFREFVSCY